MWSFLADLIFGPRSSSDDGGDHPKWDVVWRRDRTDGVAWVEVIRRPDGLFYFVESVREYVRDPIFGDYESEGPLQTSGLYASAEDAEREAFLEVSWLRQVRD
ncbi:hypothetical protein [Brevundimonas sp.]|uniref:hypothetical protein n=1 Tax=Brevundimonas sp. TaxID=1871086 RepID=UPI0025BC7983|nr:hypothetical protein [Brevundimonas sp.]